MTVPVPQIPTVQADDTHERRRFGDVPFVPPEEYPKAIKVAGQSVLATSAAHEQALTTPAAPSEPSEPFEDTPGPESVGTP